MKRIGAYEKIASFMQKEKQPYEFKRKYAQIRAEEFKSECDRRGLNCHVSVGGLDSIVLFLFLREACQIDVPGVSASTLEDKSIQRVHKAIGIINVPPLKRDDGKLWTKARVIQEFGFPVISKEIAGKIELLQNPTEKNKTVRHAIITGETGEYGGWQKNSKMQLKQKWLELFGGYENENEGCDFRKPDFLVSSKCCYYLKEKNCDNWGKDPKGKYPNIHPTQEPVCLLKKLIKIFTDEGDVVIDPCCGSGSTLRAAMELGRPSYGFEIDRNFYERAKAEMLVENYGEVSMRAEDSRTGQRNIFDMLEE